MVNSYKVAIHYENDCGFVEFLPQTNSVKVTLDNIGKAREVENYLAQSHELAAAQADLRTFSHKTMKASDNIESFKLVMSRLWQQTGVFVDWSRPS